MRQALANIGANICAKIGAKTGGMRRRLRFGSKAAFHLALAASSEWRRAAARSLP
jgi:hypothetical protein